MEVIYSFAVYRLMIRTNDHHTERTKKYIKKYKNIL